MKHPLLLLPLLPISLSCATEDATQLAVYDTENHKLTSNGSYYILPAENETFGGLRKSHPWRPCNSFVIQAQREADVGLPLRFTPLNDTSSGTILVSTNILVQFDMITQCVEPMYWHVTDLSPMWSSSSEDELRLHVAVGKDEVAEFPDPLTTEFVFRIERYDGNDKTKKGYKLVSCAGGKGPCRDLGLHAYKERTWLAMSDSPFVVVFKKGHPYA